MDVNQARALSRVDLNLLVILALLLRERHLSRVANELYVSQSAVSRSLKKAREVFDDPLFTRTVNGLLPTARALELERELEPLLPALLQLFSRGKFIPAECDSTFSISMPPYIGVSLVPALYQFLAENAPRVAIAELPTKASPWGLLDSNQLDFAFHYEDTRSASYVSRLIGHIYPVLYAREGHPLTRFADLGLEQILEYPVVGMLVEEDSRQTFRSPISRIFADLMKDHRKLQLRSTQAGTLLNVISNSDAVLFGSNGFSPESDSGRNYVKLFSLEKNKKYTLPVYLLQHARNESSPDHQWMAELLYEQSTGIIES